MAVSCSGQPRRAAARLNDAGLRSVLDYVQDRDETATEKRLAESELQEARDNIRMAALEVRRHEEALRLRTLKSPVSGVVTERNMQPGEMADPSDSRKPILRIADIGTLYAEAVLPAEAYAHVKAGHRATVRVDTPQPMAVAGVVRVVDRVLDAGSGTFGVRLEVANPNLAIPAGIQCRADFPDVPASSAGKVRRNPPKAAM
mgnify:CR=1 FL=1